MTTTHTTAATATPASGKARLGWVLGLTSTAYFMVVLDSSVVLTALPRMQRDLHAGLASLQWTINAYGIAFAAGIITAAALGDRFGRRRIFNIGLALFTLASAGCAIAPNAAELIAARTVQGLGAAVVMPLSLTILTAAFPPQRRGLIVGIYGGLAGLAVAAGPLVGGAVTEGLDWHWIFWLNVPIGLIATAFATRLLPESHGAPERLDLIGVTLVTAGVVAIVWALVRANDAGWSSPEILSTLLAGSALLLAFLAWENRAAEPLVPLRLFRNRTFGPAAGYRLRHRDRQRRLLRPRTPGHPGQRHRRFPARPMVLRRVCPARGIDLDRDRLAHVRCGHRNQAGRRRPRHRLIRRPKETGNTRPPARPVSQHARGRDSDDDQDCRLRGHVPDSDRHPRSGTVCWFCAAR